MRRERLIRIADAADSWVRFVVIISVVVINGIWEELLIQSAEAMMLIRWSWDVVRYDLRWAVQEKLRRTFTQGNVVSL
jgi:hypothetical protein